MDGRPGRRDSDIAARVRETKPEIDPLDAVSARADLERALFGREGARVELSGRYVLNRKIGDGGCGVVYAGWDKVLERNVAIKFVRADVGATIPNLALEDEARALARVAHSNLIRVFDLGSHGPGDFDAHPGVFDHVGPGAFIVMELVQGEELGQWLDSTSRSPESIVEVFGQAGRALAEIHAAGLVHLDFKPSNVMIEKGGRAMVLDLGLCRAAGPPALARGGPGYNSRSVTDAIPRKPAF